MNTNTSQGQILIPFAQFSYLLPYDSAGRLGTTLWWTSQEFSSVHNITMFTMLMYHLGGGEVNNRPVGGRSSQTPHQHNHQQQHQVHCTASGKQHFPKLKSDRPQFRLI
jgi:hypothetical protein